MDENFTKNRHTWYVLFLTLALYGGMYTFSRVGGLIVATVSPAAAEVCMQKTESAVAAKLEFPRRTFFTAYPPLLLFFFPAVWLEGRFAPRF